MEDWIERYAEALREQLIAASGGSLEGLGPRGVEAVLDLARIVAHGTERKNAPLSTYLAGRYVATRTAAGAGAEAALAEAVAVAEELLGPQTG